ncbi:MAG: hypothetical protein V4477_23860 [Pseudomonadota bacterium]|uniref:hypothetical protein n=1 Tax=Tardiphaga sp. TaxID=1926292 RepID=UPI0033521ACE
MPMSPSQLQVIQGGKDADELIATMLQALRLANACGSETTYDLLRMALLNEGVQLAKVLAAR